MQKKNLINFRQVWLPMDRQIKSIKLYFEKKNTILFFIIVTIKYNTKSIGISQFCLHGAPEHWAVTCDNGKYTNGIT